MKDVNGIMTPFDNHVAPVCGANEQAGGGTKGGESLPEGMKQSAPGDTGTWPTTTNLPGQTKGGGDRPKDMAGS